MIRAVLNSVSGELIVNDTNFVSWNDRQNVISRSKNYHGVIITESLDLTFIGAAYEYLLNLDNTYDIAAECTVKIQVYDDLNGWSTDFEGYIDFTTKSQNDNSGSQITYSAYSDNFAKKLLEREEIDIPYDRLTTLDDDTITPFTNEYIEVDVLGMEVTNKTPFDILESLSVGYSVLYPTISNNNLNGFQSTVLKDATGSGGGGAAPDDAWITDRAFFIADGLSGYMSSEITISWKGAAQDSTRFYIRDYRSSLIPVDVYDSGSVIREDASGNGDLTFTFTYDFYSDSRLTFAWVHGTAFTNVNATENSFITTSKLDPTPCKFVPAIQAWKRTIESYTGVTDAVLSDLLNSGDASNIWLTNGKLLRQYPTGYEQTDSNTVAQLTFNIKDLFNDTDAVFNIGAGVEYSGGQYNLRVEEKDYFYDSDVILVIGKESIKEDSFSRDRDLTYYHNKIDVGYSFEKVEEEGAQEDFNTNSSYSTPVLYDNPLEIISKTIASGRAIEETRRKEVDLEETTDYKFDNNNFFFNVYDNSGTWIQRTDEDFAEVNGIDEITTPINLYITPKRNFKRNSWLFNTGFKGYADKTLKYNKSEITTDLETRLDSESEVVRENEDININDLNTALFSGHVVNFSAPVGSSTFNLLKSNPYKLIKYWDMLIDNWAYGWVKEVSTSPIDRDTNWQIIEATGFVEGESYRLLQDGAYRLLEDGSIRLLED